MTWKQLKATTRDTEVAHLFDQDGDNVDENIQQNAGAKKI